MRKPEIILTEEQYRHIQEDFNQMSRTHCHTEHVEPIVTLSLSKGVIYPNGSGGFELKVTLSLSKGELARPEQAC